MKNILVLQYQRTATLIDLCLPKPLSNSSVGREDTKPYTIPTSAPVPTSVPVPT